MSKTYSDLAHIPWALGIMAAGLVLYFAGVPISFIMAFAGSANMVTRAVTKGEYQAIEERFGGLRANMPTFYGFRFWHWNKHTFRETLYAIVVSFAAATALYLIWHI